MKIEYDSETDVLTIEGTRYAGGMFRAFGPFAEMGQVLRIDKVEDGTITVNRLYAVEKFLDKIKDDKAAEAIVGLVKDMQP